ncbi:MAG: MFS transporter [Phycisphaerales bacterium]
MTTPPAGFISPRQAVSLLFVANGWAMASWVAHLPAIKRTLGLTDSALGACLWAVAAGALVAMPLAGALATRWGSRPVAIALGCALCAAIALPALAPTPAMLICAFLLLGACNGGLDVSMNANAVSVEHVLARPIMSQVHAMYSLGNLLGALTSSALIALDFAPTMQLLGQGAALALLIAVIAPFMQHPTLDLRSEGPHFAAPRRGILVLGALAFCALLAEGAIGDWSAVYLRDTLNARDATAPLGFAAFALTMTIGRLAGAFAAGRGWADRAASIGCIGATAALTLALLVNIPIVSMVAFALVGVGIANTVPLLFAAAGRVPGIPPGRGIAATATLGYAGLLAGPALIGQVAGFAGLRGGMGVVVACLLILGATWSLRPRGTTLSAS